MNLPTAMDEGIEVHIEGDWMTRGHKVYVYRRHSAGGDVLTVVTPPEDAPSTLAFPTFRWEPVDYSKQNEPTFHFPPGVLEGIVSAAQGKVPATAGLPAHLADVQTVRDRLLAIVENVVNSDIAREANS